MTTADYPELAEDESLVDLRCSVVVVHRDQFLLVDRSERSDDWVLPGGRPRAGESMASCARREAFEETGLHVDPARCAFVGEVIDPTTRARTVELVFLATLERDDRLTPTAGEPGHRPVWVTRDELRTVRLRPPIAGFLPDLVRGTRDTAPYLGNLWRPGQRGQAAAGE